jgi:hypothetical protein
MSGCVRGAAGDLLGSVQSRVLIWAARSHMWVLL